MGILSKLHDYVDGGVLSSSDWNDELNQIINTLRGTLDTAIITIQGQTTAANDPILLLKSNGGGNLLFVDFFDFGGAPLNGLRLLNSGVLHYVADSGLPIFIVSSSLLCINLNADLLDGQSSADLQTALYAYQVHSVFWNDADAATAPDRVAWCSTSSGTVGFITKLKAQQQGVASADAQTVLTFRLNGVSVGTVTINGNSVAVVINDIADVPLDDSITGQLASRIEIAVTSYTGTTKHTDITASITLKMKFVQ